MFPGGTIWILTHGHLGHLRFESGEKANRPEVGMIVLPLSVVESKSAPLHFGQPRGPNVKPTGGGVLGETWGLCLQ